MMFTVFLTLQIVVTALLIFVILIQKSDGGGLGIGTSESKLFSTRGRANLLSRSTAVLGTLFFALSLALAVSSKPDSNFERLFAPQNSSPSNPLATEPLQDDTKQDDSNNEAVPLFTPEDIQSLDGIPGSSNEEDQPKDAVPLAQ